MKSDVILLLDDEQLALSYLKDIVVEVKNRFQEFKNYDVIVCSNYYEFKILLEKHTPKIIFLDIQMPTKNGIEIAEEIINNKNYYNYPINSGLPFIVFSTAYDNFAYQAFKLEATDYILKPTSEEEVLKVFNKIKLNYNNYINNNEDKISINVSGLDINVPISDVIYFKADMKYISVCTNKKQFLINDTILNLEKNYPSFIKTHRAYLVNPNFISKFFNKDGAWFLSLKDTNEILPVSRRQKYDIEKKINYKLLID